MSSFPGFAIPGVQGLGLLTNLVSVLSRSPQRSIGGIIPDCTVEEEGTDELVATRHPVEQGASISDHVYKQPAQLVMRVAWSNASASAFGDPNYVTSIYNQLLALQVSGQLFTVTTGKRQYQNMQMLRITQRTDEKTELALEVIANFEQILIATTSQTVVPPASVQKDPTQTAQVQNLGSQNLKPSTIQSLGH